MMAPGASSTRHRRVSEVREKPVVYALVSVYAGGAHFEHEF